MGDLMCPENCGGFVRTIHFEVMSDGSGGAAEGRCDECFVYFKLEFHHEDFKRE